MPNVTDLVPAFLEATTAVTGNITNLVLRTKANGFMERAKFEATKEQIIMVMGKIRATHEAELIMENLEQIAKTQDRIDNLEKQGRLHGPSLEMAMDQLELLNEGLRRNVKEIENRNAWN